MHIKQTQTHNTHTQTLCFSSIMPPQTALYLRITLAHNCSERVLHYSGSFWCRRVSCALQRWSDLIRLQRRSQSLECQLISWLRQMRTNRAQRSPTKKKHKTNIQVQDNKCVCLKHKWKHRQLFQQSCSLQAAVTVCPSVLKIQTCTICEGFLLEKWWKRKLWSAVESLSVS